MLVLVHWYQPDPVSRAEHLLDLIARPIPRQPGIIPKGIVFSFSSLF